MQKFFLFILLYSASLLADASTLYSINDGSWDDVNNWSTSPGGTSCGCLPSTSDNIIVDNSLFYTNLTISSGGSISLSTGQILQGGTITVQGGTLDLLNGQILASDLNIISGSTLNIGATAQLTSNNFINSSNGVVVNGTLSVYGNFQNSGYIDGSGFLGHTPASTVGNVNPIITIFTVIVMPVKLLNASYNSESTGSVIKWETTAEKENKGFEIYISEDGENFKLSGFVEGKNNTNGVSDYSYSLQLSASCYIKILQVDDDGHKEDLKTIFVYVNTPKTSLLIYPNPVTPGEPVNIAITNNEEEDPSIILYDLNGNILQGMDSDDISSLSTTDLKTGSYIIELLGKTNKQKEYLIVR